MSARLTPSLAARLAAIATALVALAFAPASLRAQASTGAIGVSTYILTPPLSATGVKPLEFANIIPGTTTVIVNPNTVQSGQFRIAGTQNMRSIDITFTLPPALTGPAGATIPLNFNGNYAALCELDAGGNCLTASYLAWNPVTTPTFRDTPERYGGAGRKRYVNNEFTVWIGGNALPAATQAPGAYSGTIGVTLVVN